MARSNHDTAPDRPCDSVEGGCEIGELFSLLSRAHMLDVLHIFILETPGEPKRFVDLQGRLQISPNTLSSRLKELVEAGLLTRKAFNEIPPRVDYAATEKALDLRYVFNALHEWAQSHALKPEHEPVTAKATA